MTRIQGKSDTLYLNEQFAGGKFTADLVDWSPALEGFFDDEAIEHYVLMMDALVGQLYRLEKRDINYVLVPVRKEEGV